MFHAFCRGANFLAFLRDSSTPYFNILLERLNRATSQKNFSDDRLFSQPSKNELWSNSPSHTPPPDDPELQTFLRSNLASGAKTITFLTEVTHRYLVLRPRSINNSWVFFRFNSQSDSRPGKIQKLIRFVNSNEEVKIAVLLKYPRPLSEGEAEYGDPYRPYRIEGFNVGEVFQSELADEVVIPLEGIVHHAVHREFECNNLRKRVRYVMPITKVSGVQHMFFNLLNSCSRTRCTRIFKQTKHLM